MATAKDKSKKNEISTSHAIQPQPLLTKSKYLIGLSCQRCLWKSFHAKHEIPEKSESEQHMMNQGTMVGELAQELYPGGVDASDDNFPVSLEKSQELLKSQVTLFEAGFKVEQLYARADILEPVGRGFFDLTEVKSSTQVKPEHIEDVAFQKYCYEKAGLKIRNCFLMHINNKYVKNGKIKIKELFVPEDITQDVNESIKDVPKNVARMLRTISSDTCPKNAKDSVTCGDPFECPIRDDCWSFMPEDSVFDLYGGKKKAMELFESGILAIKDIPDDYKLNDNQMIQHGCVKTKKVHIHPGEIKKFLDTLKYPLYFLDFETFSASIPIHDGTRPYQQIPFQFSLHVITKKGAKPKQYSYLAETSADPRKELAEKLIELLGDKGSIIAYNSGFEERALKELAEFLPKHHAKLMSFTERLIDLLQPFKNFYYYNPKQGGSASLKVVLPALTGKSYDELEIGEGTTAALKFLHITQGSPAEKITPDEIKKVRADLLEYCALDTEGMIWIIEKLRKICE